MSAPSHWGLLTEAEAQAYHELQKLGAAILARTRGRPTARLFQTLLTQVRKFVVRDGHIDWKRSLVCGIAWLDRSIVVNARQFGFLIRRSRSTINSGFHALGLHTRAVSATDILELLRFFPVLLPGSGEVRQWTFRSIGEHPEDPLPAARTGEFSIGADDFDFSFDETL
jgi:hypothetical protein